MAKSIGTGSWQTLPSQLVLAALKLTLKTPSLSMMDRLANLATFPGLDLPMEVGLLGDLGSV